MTARHYSPRSVAIVLAELTWIGVTLAVAVGVDLQRRQGAVLPNQLVQQVGFGVLFYLATFYYCDLYNFAGTQVPREFVTTALRAFSTLAVALGAIFLCTRWLTVGSATMFLHLLLTIGFVIAMRMRIDGVLTRFGIVTKIAIVGTGAEARRLAEEIQRRREYGHEVCCFVGTNSDEHGILISAPNPGTKRVPVIASAGLLEFARRHRIKRILVATADLGRALPLDDLLRCKTGGLEIEDGHTFYERLLGCIFTAGLSPEWLIFSDGFVRPARTRIVKRAVDIFTASALLVISAPLCLLVALVIALEDGRPVLFSQMRAGRLGRPFSLYKFRSMQVDAEAETGPKWAEVDDPRVTWVGRWIRTLRIDEIPQAWNVLRGDMSFIGPRPERPEFVAELRSLIPYYDHRHAVRPGITGWAQVNYPYGATVDDARRKLEFDLYYLKNLSVLVDVYILVRTIKIIMFGWGSR